MENQVYSQNGINDALLEESHTTINGKGDYTAFHDGYTEITVQTNITEMDGFIRRIGQMLNGNSDIAYLGSDRGLFI
jgi:hypothetical protein